MPAIYLLFILASAFFHSFYNFLMRRSGGSRSYLVAMFVVSASVAFTVAAIFGSFKGVVLQDVAVLYVASLFYVLYQVFVSKSYELGNISSMYPLTILSPLFIPFWAYFLLSEKISILSALGIFVAVLGALAVKLNKLSWFEFSKMFKITKDYKAARFALAASLMYSFGSTLDKLKIGSFDIFAFVFLLLGFMALNMVLYLRLVEKKKLEFGKGAARWNIILGGTVVFLSFAFFRFALRDIMVSIAVPLRQMSVVFAILLGVFVLKEKISPSKLFGVAVVLAGLVLINWGL